MRLRLPSIVRQLVHAHISGRVPRREDELETAIDLLEAAVIVVTAALSAAVVFLLAQPTDLPVLKTSQPEA